MPARVLSLHAYPVKACRAVDLAAAEVTPRGLRHDREFMVTTPDGAHLSQRELPALATVRVAYDGDLLRLTAARGEYEHRPVREGPRLEVTVHRRPCPGVDQGDEAAAWLSELLSRPCRLVRCPDGEGKPVNPRYGEGRTAYVDGYPLTVVSQESLDELNRRLDRPLPLSRFRQNVVVSGWGEPHREDDVRRMRIGAVVLRPVKQDDRCVVTTIDQVTGTRTREPLRTLAAYRTVEQDIMFGMFALVERAGTVRVGDAVEVLEWAY